MTKPVFVSAECDIVVQFYDVDPMRIVWHGNYVRFLEQARCVLFDKIDYNYQAMEDSGYSWPIVDIRLKYVASARFGDTVRVRAEIVEYEMRLKIKYIVTDVKTGIVLTKAHSIQVAVASGAQELQFESPQILFDKIRPFLDAD